MTGKKREKPLSKSSFSNYDFVLKKDVIYSPFDGVYSVPFVMPDEDLSRPDSEEITTGKSYNFSDFLKAVVCFSVLILFFLPSLKSNTTAIEFVYGKDKSVSVQSFHFEEICYGIDALKKEIRAEDRAYIKATKLLKKDEEPAVEVGKPVSTEPETESFIWPTKGALAISSPYGYRDPKISGWSFHGGIDIVTGNGDSTGVPVVAAKSGTVIYVSESYRGYGHQVLIDHGEGITTRYAHMKANSISVCVGEKVTAGQQIGKIGSTGNTTGPHLHFEIMVDGVKVEPKEFLQSKYNAPTS